MAVWLCSCLAAAIIDQVYESGMKALENKEYDTAIQMFDQVVEQEQRLSEAYRGTGIAWLSKGSYPEAIAAFSRSLNYMEEPDEKFEKDVLFYLAQARMEYGEVDKAIEEYGNILKKGEDAQAFFLRGKAYVREENFENAQKDFLRAVKDCEDYDLYINIYRIYQEAGKRRGRTAISGYGSFDGTEDGGRLLSPGADL